MGLLSPSYARAITLLRLRGASSWWTCMAGVRSGLRLHQARDASKALSDLGGFGSVTLEDSGQIHLVELNL